MFEPTTSAPYLKLTSWETSLLSKQRARTQVPTTRGFSLPDGNGIRSMQDFLRIIQPLQLPLLSSTNLHDPVKIGEGSSYKVFRCKDRRNARLVAVKQIKLHYNPAQHRQFQRIVYCILRDLEVMHHEPIAMHSSIIGLLGYGWG
jgi:serine/threonine protein kinase